MFIYSVLNLIVPLVMGFVVVPFGLVAIFNRFDISCPFWYAVVLAVIISWTLGKIREELAEYIGYEDCLWTYQCLHLPTLY
jgi:hypothetical protein